MKVEDLAAELGQDKIPWRLFTPDNASKDYCVLWLQGWSSSMDSHREGIERMVEKSNTVFATLDPAGHGLHELPLEESTRRQHLEEIMAIYDELTPRGFKKIIVAGGSYGAYMAALLVGKRPVHTVVLRAPANYPDNEFELKYRETWRWKDYTAYLENKKSNDMLTSTSATKAIKNFKGFVYVMEHELDDVVPPEMPKSYFKAAKHGNYLIVPKTKHSPKLMKNPELHYAYVEQFITDIVLAVKLQDKMNAD